VDRRTGILILLEKLTPFGRVVARIAGVVFIASGVWMLARGF
jgi:predicted metal-binding membrane protein